MEVTRATRHACGAALPCKPDARALPAPGSACAGARIGSGAHLAPGSVAERRAGGNFVLSAASLLLPRGCGAAGSAFGPRRGDAWWRWRIMARPGSGAAKQGQPRRTCSARRGEMVCHGDASTHGPRGAGWMGPYLPVGPVGAACAVPTLLNGRGPWM